MQYTFGFFVNNNTGKSTVETAGSLASADNNVETAGSVACLLGGNSTPDSFGSKDMFGTPDLSNIDTGFFAANTSVETAGTVAFGPASYDASFSGGSDCGAGASVGGGDCGASCGGGSFASVC